MRTRMCGRSDDVGSISTLTASGSLKRSASQQGHDRSGARTPPNGGGNGGLGSSSCSAMNGGGSPGKGPDKERHHANNKLRNNKLVVMVCTNLSNLGCHSIYSVLASFFPQEARAKGMSDEGVGLVFAIFAALIFVCSPFAGRLMSKHGKVWVYIWGICMVSVSSILFAAASYVPYGMPFAAFCFTMRLIQGIGSAFEETAMYAIIADLDKENVTLYLGICEISTGLGYMIGPPLGGFLYSWGGFAAPFIVLGLAVAPSALLLYHALPPENYRIGSKGGEEGDDKPDVPMRTLLRNPQVMVIAVAAMLANSDYAFLEPTLGDHAARMGLASTPDAIGMLFSVAMTSYTLSCPVIGMLAKRERLGPRAVIVTGLMLQLLGFVLIGPCPMLHLDGLGMGQMVAALVVFGIGESMSMTPVMDDMMRSCGSQADESVNGLSSLMASAFSFGQMIGPLIGSALTSRMGFDYASLLMAISLAAHVGVIAFVDTVRPRPRLRDTGGSYTELTPMTPVFEPESASAD